VTPSRTPTTEELEGLAVKYETLASMRRARERGEPAPDKSELQRLVSAFPGALFELDTLSMKEIEARASALRAAIAHGAGGEEVPRWMGWMARYHQLVRLELVSRRTGRSSAGPRARATSLAIVAIAAEAVTSAHEIEAALFARQRRGIGR